MEQTWALSKKIGTNQNFVMKKWNKPKLFCKKLEQTVILSQKLEQTSTLLPKNGTNLGFFEKNLFQFFVKKLRFVPFLRHIWGLFHFLVTKLKFVPIFDAKLQFVPIFFKKI